MLRRCHCDFGTSLAAFRTWRRTTFDEPINGTYFVYRLAYRLIKSLRIHQKSPVRRIPIGCNLYFITQQLDYETFYDWYDLTSFEYKYSH